MRRAGRGALTRVLRTLSAAALVLPLSGCSLVSYIVGKEKRDVYKFEQPFTVSDPDFRRSAEALGTPMVGGNSAELLRNGDEIFPAMTKDIREAKKTVNLETYIFQPDRAGRIFADAMIEAAKRGVQVRLIVDGWGGKYKGLKKELDDAGVIAKKYRPLRVFSIHKVGKRTHRKILVVDGRICYTGGLGIDERWLGNARNTKEWRDTQVRVVGPVAAEMQAIFSENWTFTTGEILVGEDFYPPQPPAGSITAQAIKASRGDSTSLAKMMYFVAIGSAAKFIHIQNAYFLPDKQVREELTKARKRGVDVQVMVPGRNIDLPMVRQASWKNYGELLEAGVKIWEYQPTMLHNKTMVVDGIYSTIGSINFDARSMAANAEESLAFYDRDFAAKMEAMFQNDTKRCQQITLKMWKHRGFPKRMSELIFWVFSPYY
jgi:cardiolipin synthase